MNGFTIQSVSDEGTYYLVKNWRKNKTFWVSKTEMKQEYLYTSGKFAMNALEKLLNMMPDCAEDKLSAIYFSESGNIVEYGQIKVENLGNNWKQNYKAKMFRFGTIIQNFKLEEVSEMRVRFGKTSMTWDHIALCDRIAWCGKRLIVHTETEGEYIVDCGNENEAERAYILVLKNGYLDASKYECMN